MVAVLMLGIQFIPVDRSNPPVEADVQAPPVVKEILHRACFDCHSHETAWPWYSRVAPVSWFVAHHVNEGRSDLNFSRWPAYDLDAQDHILREVHEVIKAGEMPLDSYVMGHPEARLSPQDRAQLLDWASQGLPDESDLFR